MRLTLDSIRHAEFGDVLAACHERMSLYEAPGPEGEPEEDTQLEQRISRTLDEVPDLHTFFLAAKGWFGYWADSYAAEEGYGTRSQEYKQNKARRDLMDDMARAARLRYEGASRRLTQLHDEREGADMRTGRA